MIGCIKISVGASARPSVSVNSGDHVDVSVGASTRPSLYIEHICKFAQDALLVVSPEVVWLNEGNGYTAEFEVLSNVEWIIE